MTETQKIIKYCAIALAVVIIINIFYFLFSLGSFFLGFETNTNSTTEEQTILDNSIINLDIDLDYTKLNIINSDDYKVVTNNKYLKINNVNNTLKIEEERKLFSKSFKNSELTIYIPNDKIFQDIDIDTGAGSINMENISSEELNLDLGAGKVAINYLTVSRKADIDSGVGSLDIYSGSINNLNLDMGVGEVNIKGILTGKNDIDAGVGSLNIELINSLNNYSIFIEKGLGKVSVNNIESKDDYSNNQGSNYIKINGGVGSINLKTAE